MVIHYFITNETFSHFQRGHFYQRNLKPPPSPSTLSPPLSFDLCQYYISILNTIPTIDPHPILIQSPIKFPSANHQRGLKVLRHLTVS
jgi:hypothetical protein